MGISESLSADPSSTVIACVFARMAMSFNALVTSLLVRLAVTFLLR